MIEAEKSVVIGATIDSVWDYVQDIRRWANLFPGCRECTVVDERRSQWIIKVGAGGLIRTVHVLVQVDQWDGPERVDFSYKLETEPVVGSGCYLASSKGAEATEIALKVRVEGSGPMAPMWEAISKPLLPQLAGSFAGKLKDEIERSAGAPVPQLAVAAETPAAIAIIANWLRKLWRALSGSGKTAIDPDKKEGKS